MNQHEREIVKGIKRVESAKTAQRVYTPNGRSPVCIPQIGTSGVGICEVCGEVIDRSKREACSAVPPEYRWGIEFS